MGLECVGTLWQKDTAACLQCWHSALLFGHWMSQIAAPSHVKLCLGNPNTGRNAKSSLPAVVSHPTFNTGLGKRGPCKSEKQVVNRTKADDQQENWFFSFGFSFGSTSGILHAAQLNFSWWWPCQNVDCMGQGRWAQSDSYTNCLGPTLIWSGGSVNMTFFVCVQRQHKYEYLQVAMPAWE